MNRSYLSALTLVLATLSAGHALASDAATPKTRAQVKAELMEAIRTGDFIANSETGQKANEMYPDRYPAKPVVEGKTREQVRAELMQAIRTGDMIVDYENSKKANEMYPDRYPAKPVVEGKTREQVKAELMQAKRSGHMPELTVG